jgi:tellurite resistance protein TerC
MFYFVLANLGHHLHDIDSLEKLRLITQKYCPDLHYKSTGLENMLKEYRHHMGISYVTGFIIEQTLSIDNVFVMLVLLQGFGVSLRNYKRVLFWGILGAIVLRFLFIFLGSALVQKFDWILLVFGVFLVYQSVHLLIAKDHGMKDPQTHPVVRFLSKHIRLIPHYIGGKFWTFKDKKLFFTPLFVVVVMIEFTDLIFAFDSIPAVFAVTRDPYVVFFSNIFAIIGLRSLFFLLASLVEKFRFLKHGVSILLAFVGFKLLLHSWLDEIGFKSWYSLVFIGIVISMSILLSALFPVKKSVRDSNQTTE